MRTNKEEPSEFPDDINVPISDILTYQIGFKGTNWVIRAYGKNILEAMQSANLDKEQLLLANQIYQV